MARWKLLQPHHLNVPGTEWEYSENDRKTGKPKRTRFPVPLYLNPLSPDDCNYKDHDDEGIIIVTNAQDNAYPKDYIFKGDPTPDMEPLDDEARAISASFASRWLHPIEGLPAQGGYSQSLLDSVQTQFAEAAAKGNEAVAAQAEGVKEVLTAMASMMKQNQDLIAALAADRVPASARRA